MAKPRLIIGNKNYSSWSLRPWLYLRHLGVDFEEYRLPLDTPRFAAEIAELSPTRRVPVLHHGDVVVWESVAILAYVDEVFGGGRGLPADRAARATARSVIAEMHAGFRALREQLPMSCRRRGRPPQRFDGDARADVARVIELWRDCRRRFGVGGPFLFGELGIADCMYAPVVFRFVGYGVELEGEAADYAQTMLALEPMQEWMAAARAETEVVAADEVE